MRRAPELAGREGVALSDAAWTLAGEEARAGEPRHRREDPGWLLTGQPPARLFKSAHPDLL